jgi:hypothetical protein
LATAFFFGGETLLADRNRHAQFPHNSREIRTPVNGCESTTSLIGVGLHSLLHHPEELARFRDQPELRTAGVEELLRYESPAQKNARVVIAMILLSCTRPWRYWLLK